MIFKISVLKLVRIPMLPKSDKNAWNCKTCLHCRSYRKETARLRSPIFFLIYGYTTLIFVLFTFSNMTAVWISRNFEDKIINEHLPCYSPPLTSMFVMSFLVCRAGILLCLKQSLLLKYWFSYHLSSNGSFCLVCDKKNGTRCWSREWHGCFLPSPCTAFSQSLSVNSFRWRIRGERAGNA